MARNQFGGFGGPNMQQLMRQAQKMQEQMQKAQEELDAKVYEASAGGGMVSVKVSGKRELLDKPISPQLSAIMESRSVYRHSSGGSSIAVSAEDERYCISVAAPDCTSA